MDFMDPIFSLVERQMIRGRKLIEFGRRIEAKNTLLQLLSYGEVPTHVREEAHYMLAELHLDSQRFRKARRHLTAVLALRPKSAKAHYELAMAIDRDPNANQLRAWKLLRRALRLQPENPRYWNALGQTGLRLGKRKSALIAFRKAMSFGPEEIPLIGEIAEGLVRLQRDSEARAFLLVARFRFAGSVAFEKLWKTFCFSELARSQETRRTRLSRGDSSKAHILPFVRIQSESIYNESSSEEEPTILRLDRFSQQQPHMPRLLAFRPGPRYVP